MAGQPFDCPKNWEYKNDARYQSILKTAYANFLLRIAFGTVEVPKEAVDTRPTHHSFFRELAPPLFPYIAGHYRGENFRCLKNYYVQVKSDRRVGYPPAIVADCMQRLKNDVIAAVDSLDASKGVVPDNIHVLNAVKLTSFILNEFFLIHPYANGNGHIGRTVVWMILSRYGYRPHRLHIDHSPSYAQQLMAYRDGNRQLLEAFLLSCMLP